MIRMFQNAHAELRASPEPMPGVTLAMASLLTLLPVAFLAGSLADIVASLIACLFLVRVYMARGDDVFREPWLIVALALWGFLVIRGLTSVNPERSTLQALPWIRFIIFAAAVQHLFNRSQALERLVLLSVCAMALFGAGDAIFQYFAGQDIFGQKPFISEKSGYRLTGPLPNPMIGMLLFFVGLPALVLFAQRAAEPKQSRHARLLGAAGLLLIFTAILMSGERMVLLQCLVGLGVISLIVRVPRQTLAAAAGCAFVGIMAILTILPSVRERHASTVQHLSAPLQSGYAKAMIASTDLFRANPLFGVGIKNFREACPAYVSDPEYGDVCKLIHPHNVWMQLSIETGIIGAIGFFALFGFGVYPAVRLWRYWSVEPLMAGAALSVLIKLWPLATSGNFFANWRAATFWFAFAMATGVARTARNRQRLRTMPAKASFPAVEPSFAYTRNA